MILHFLRALLAVCLAAGLAAAQTHAQAPAEDPTFRSKTELVTVPVVVTKDGKHVPGLKMEDFHLLHNGKPEKIAVFEEVRDRRGAATQTTQAAPDVVQNYVPPESQDVVIIVINANDWYSENNVRAYLGDIAKSLAASRTPVSVLLFVRNTLVQVHSFSSSTTDLAKSVDDYLERNRQFRTLGNALSDRLDNDTTLADFPGAYLEQARLMDGRARMDAISQLAMAYRGVPGRKKLIWMANSFFAADGGGDYIDRLAPEETTYQRGGAASSAFRMAEMRDALLRTLSDANIVIYPVDLHGNTNPAYDERFAPQFNGGDRFEGTFGERANTRVSEVHNLSLQEVASKTGGKHCTDLPLRCVRAVQEDGNDYYVLGFYLQKDAKPGWHELKVESPNRGVALRARAGFEVAAKGKPEKAVVKEASASINQSAPKTDQAAFTRDPVITALAAPVDYTSVPLRLRWKAAGGEGAVRKVELYISSPVGGIKVDAGDPRLDVDLLAFVREVGKLKGTSFPESLIKKLSPQEQSRLATGGFAYKKVLDLAPGRYGIRVLLRDNTTGKIGTVSALVAIP